MQQAIIEFDEPERTQDEDRKDIAAELKAAEEEVAAEEVTAVLPRCSTGSAPRTTAVSRAPESGPRTAPERARG